MKFPVKQFAGICALSFLLGIGSGAASHGVNHWRLSVTELVVWGVVIHAVADWLLQNEWMALNKMKRCPAKWALRVPFRFRFRERAALREGYFVSWQTPWWQRHPAAYVHATIHGALLAIIFGWVAVPLALAHLVIDCRWVVEKWSRLIAQTQPAAHRALTDKLGLAAKVTAEHSGPQGERVIDGLEGVQIDTVTVPLFDIGAFVRMMNDQVWHVACIAVAALLVG